MTERTLIENLRRGTKLENQAADKIEILTDYTVNQALALARFRAALEQIERWDGFPETGEFWDRDKERPVSYGAQNGSNGERDFMRSIARAALTNGER